MVSPLSPITSVTNRALNEVANVEKLLSMGANTRSTSTREAPVFEREAARLVPFDLPLAMRGATESHALYPIFSTGGLVFPFNPSVSEGISVKYNSMEMVHSNESYHVYQATENVHINLSNCTWVCDTFANAVYTLSVIHFLRTYSFMDFGKATTGVIRGRPPSPMWFSAFGTYAYNRVPVLLQKADWNFPDDQDYVGVPDPGTPGWDTCKLVSAGSTASTGSVTWLPIKFTVSSISLIVQHAPRYWINWNLDDYRSGKMLDRTPTRSFHDILPVEGQGSGTVAKGGSGGGNTNANITAQNQAKIQAAFNAPDVSVSAF